MEGILKKLYNFIEKVFMLVVAVFCKIILKKEVTVDVMKVIGEFFKFCLVGVSNTVLSYALNILVLCFLEPFNVVWDYLAGNIVAFILSVLWSFYWNNKYVFNQNDNMNEKETRRVVLQKLIKTYLSYSVTGIILCNFLSYIWINIFGISKLLAPLINLIISVPVNFIINKLWAFK